MTKLLGFLTYTAGVLVVGAVCAWLVLGPKPERPQCLAGVSEGTTYSTEWSASLATDTLDTIVKLKELQEAYDSAQNTITELRNGYSEQVLTYQKQIEQLDDSLASEKRFMNEIIAEKIQLKEALKQLRTDYIALANKNAALERSSIEELAKAHKEGTKVTQRELPPIMRAVVEAVGIPDGRPVPRMAVR